MYYFKVIDNDVYKFKVNYDLASVQKYLYYLAIDLGKTVHSNYVTNRIKMLIKFIRHIMLNILVKVKILNHYLKWIVKK